MSDRPVGILLAAGKSQRFGSNKLLHPVINNIPMLFSSAQTLASVLPDSLVVISPALVAHTSQLDAFGLNVVVNYEAEQGIGSSIACGVNASNNASGWLVALADMPYIKTQTISLLADEMQHGADIVAPVYEGQRGHPVGFSHRYYDELSALSEDIGARDIINTHQDSLTLLPVQDAGVVKDIDHRHDLT